MSYICDPMDYTQEASLFFIISWRSLLKLISIQLVMPSNHLILWHLFFLLQASICPRIRAFSNELALRNWPDLAWWWPKYWSFSSSISPFMGYLELISDCFDFFAVQGLSRVFPTTKFWASILQCSEFMVQFSHSYMTTGKTIGLTRWTFVSNVSAF